jgi:hypothetical protein
MWKTGRGGTETEFVTQIPPALRAIGSREQRFDPQSPSRLDIRTFDIRVSFEDSSFVIRVLSDGSLECYRSKMTPAPSAAAAAKKTPSSAHCEMT